MQTKLLCTQNNRGSMKTHNFFNLFLASFLLLSLDTHALVLEDLVKNNKLHFMLQNKRVGYYIGSFDPIHKGHEEIAKNVLAENLCDYVIIYPSWGGDSYKQRASVDLRLEMLFALFKEHPQIIVTRYPPKVLQNTLTQKTSKNAMVPKFNGLEFLGVVGSDTALMLTPNMDSSIAFMAGSVISPEHENHTWGGCIALPVSSFIVSMRAGDDLSSLQGRVGGRKIVKTITIKQYDEASSTLVRDLLKQQQAADKWLSKPVIKIIQENKLYQ